MGRVLKNKELINTRLATNYGGWMYCTKCNKNIGYLCYVTYDKLKLNYTCNCGSKGSALIDFEDTKEGIECNNELITIKNRFLYLIHIKQLNFIDLMYLPQFLFQLRENISNKTFCNSCKFHHQWQVYY